MSYSWGTICDSPLYLIFHPSGEMCSMLVCTQHYWWHMASIFLWPNVSFSKPSDTSSESIRCYGLWRIIVSTEFINQRWDLWYIVWPCPLLLCRRTKSSFKMSSATLQLIKCWSPSRALQTQHLEDTKGGRESVVRYLRIVWYRETQETTWSVLGNKVASRVTRLQSWGWHHPRSSWNVCTAEYMFNSLIT